MPEYNRPTQGPVPLGEIALSLPYSFLCQSFEGKKEIVRNMDPKEKQTYEAKMKAEKTVTRQM